MFFVFAKVFCTGAQPLPSFTQTLSRFAAVAILAHHRLYLLGPYFFIYRPP